MGSCRCERGRERARPPMQCGRKISGRAPVARLLQLLLLQRCARRCGNSGGRVCAAAVLLAAVHAVVEPLLATVRAAGPDEARRLRRVLPALQLFAEQVRMLVEQERRANGPRPSGRELAGEALPFFGIFGERGPAAVAGAARELAVRVFARGEDAVHAIGRRLHVTEEEVGSIKRVPRP